MNNYGNNGKDYSFQVFKILFDFYLFGKKIEKQNTELMLKNEYYFINLEWLENLKKKFDFKTMENSLNYNFHFDHTYELEQMSEKDKLISIFQTLKNKFNYYLNVTEADLKSIRIITNKNIEKKEKDYTAQINFAFVDKTIIDHLKANGFIIDVTPKCDAYIGNNNIIFENIYKPKEFCLQCIIYNDYDSFTNEYIIKFDDKEVLNEHKQKIISRYLKYYFDENKIKMDEYMEQYIYDLQNHKQIAIVYNLNKEKLKIRQSLLEQTMIKYNSKYSPINKNNYNQLIKIDENEKNSQSNIDFKNNFINGNNVIVKNGNSIQMNFNYLEGKKVNNQNQGISEINPNVKTHYLENFKIIDSGLKNFSNSCYINAVLQCLIHTRQIAKYFLQRNDNFIQFQMPLSYCFNLLLKDFYAPKNSNIINNNDLPNKLLYLCKIVNIMNNNFSPFFPNDAKDFLIFFIGRLHAELNETYENPFNIINQNDPLSNFISYFTRYYNSIISNIFNWTNQIKRKCSKCNTQILSYQTFPYLILDLEKTRKKIFMSDLNKFHMSKIDNEGWQNEYYHNRENIPINLIDCVKYYCSYENEFDFLCPICNENCRQTTVNSIYSSPNIFIFILNRGKNNIFNVKMTYPPELDLSQYIESVKSPTKYELTGVITHLGVSGPNGHFIAFCKNPINGKWYKYNDEIVSEANNYNVHNEGIAYILFYNYVKTNKNNL